MDGNVRVGLADDLRRGGREELRVRDQLRVSFETNHHLPVVGIRIDKGKGGAREAPDHFSLAAAFEAFSLTGGRVAYVRGAAAGANRGRAAGALSAGTQDQLR